MAPAIATARLRKELVNIKKDPPPGVIAEPDERNILKWHYAIRGPPGTGFEGGVYVGKLIFPNEYPMKPPGIMMLTPSGRFKPNTRLCLSMSDFHPESWNPMWSVATIIQGVQSFMASDELTTGGLKSPGSEHRRLAALSHEFNTKMFPNLFEGDIEGTFRDADVAGLKSVPEVADSSPVAFAGSVPGSAAPPEAILAKPTKARRSKRDKQPPVNEGNDGILEEGLEKLALNKSEVEENTISAEELEKRKQRNAKRRAMQKQKRQVGATGSAM